MNEVQEKEIVIAEIPKNSREVIRVAISTYEGGKTISLWRWYRESSGELRPGGGKKGGLCVGLHHLPALADALAKALATARATGRLPPT